MKGSDTVFIYCIDEKTKDNLILDGFKFIQEEQTNGQTVWIFENRNNFNYSAYDKTKLLFSNRLNF